MTNPGIIELENEVLRGRLDECKAALTALRRAQEGRTILHPGGDPPRRGAGGTSRRRAGKGGIA